MINLLLEELYTYQENAFTPVLVVALLKKPEKVGITSITLNELDVKGQYEQQKLR
ncbi:MAG: hypothetical protein ACLVKE_15215 [Clostridium baratii]